MELVKIRGRGAGINPVSRFERLTVEVEVEREEDGEPIGPRTQFFRDTSRSIIATNESPDVGFSHSVNPYRGCEHGCVYCYARPTHEYMGLSAGLDFESRILVKEEAPSLLREALSSPRWRPVPIAFSGVTDPYQPVERKLRLTRGCLEVLCDFRNPFGIVTKNHLVTRDVDLLARQAEVGGVRVFLSITSLDADVQRVLEPRASAPGRRLAALETLSRAGVPVGVMVAPVIPGLTDHEMPAILEASFAAGARSAGYIPLRLPHGVKDLFERWLETHFPDRKGRVLGRVREIRGGSLYDSRYGSRMTGEGPYAETLGALFRTTCRRLGMNLDRQPLSTAGFRVAERKGQMELF